jgi:predicted dehydrogenase
LINDGAIGAVKHISAEFCFRAGLDPNGRLFAPAYAGGSLLDVGVYNISFVNMIYGNQPVKIQSQMDIGTTGVDEIANVLLDYGSGRSAQLISAIRLNTPHDAVIYGEEGSIKLPGYWHGDTVILDNKDGNQEIKCAFEANGYQFQAIEAMACLDKGLLESPIMPIAETLAIMGILDQIRKDNGLKYPFEEA